jgi:hypothetical protein
MGACSRSQESSVTSTRFKCDHAIFVGDTGCRSIRTLECSSLLDVVSHYEVLEVGTNASSDDVHDAYGRLAKRCHLDVGSEGGES